MRLGLGLGLTLPPPGRGHNGPPPEPPYVGPLDYRAGALGVMGTIKFYSAYAGKALRVRNPDSNVESDISFKANGRLNETEIAAAKGASSTLPITKVYVQDSSGNDYSQATAAAQPLLTQDGPGGEWCIDFDGTGDRISATFAVAQPFTSYLIFLQRSWNLYDYILADLLHDRVLLIQTGGSPNVNSLAGAGSLVRAFALNEWAIATAVRNGANSAFRRNKETAATGANGSNSQTGVLLGGVLAGDYTAQMRLIGFFDFAAADDTTAQNAVIDAVASAVGVTV